MNDYNYIDMVRLCNKVAWEIADRREKKMRLIDADALKEWVETEEETKWGLSTDEVWDAIESAPTGRVRSLDVPSGRGTAAVLGRRIGC